MVNEQMLHSFDFNHWNNHHHTKLTTAGQSSFEAGSLLAKPVQSATTMDARERSVSVTEGQHLRPSKALDHEQDGGGREQAALATVFGVQEYTESNMLWERLNHESTSSKRRSLLHTGATSPVDTLHYTRSKKEGDEPLANTNMLTLPDIPSVSKFNDFLIEDEHGVDVMLPANPSSVLLHSFSPTLQRSLTNSSVQSSISLSPPATKIPADSSGAVIGPPRLFIGYPPSIFDMLEPDDDERIILWSTESSPLNTDTDSLASKPAASPQGFSSNMTATTTATQKRRSRLVNSARFSAHNLFTDGFNRLSRQRSLPSRMKLRAVKEYGDDSAVLRNRSSFTSKPGSSLEALPTRQTGERVIKAASVEKLVEKLTNSLDYTFMTDFFLTYRTFISPTQLCKLLILRFRWALENDNDNRRVVRVRTFVVIRHWLLNYFAHDFMPCRDLRVTLTSFLNSLPQHPLVKQSPRDQRIVKGLKRVIKNLKSVHYCSTLGHKKETPSVVQESHIRKSRAACADSTTGPASSMLFADDGSLDSDVSPGESDIAALDEAEPFPSLPDDVWSEEHAIAKLQYERRRREEEEERQRAEFFSASSIMSAPVTISTPSLEMRGDLSQSNDSSSELTTPLGSMDTKPVGSEKRGPLPSEFVLAAQKELAKRGNQLDLASATVMLPPPVFDPPVPGSRGRHYVPATILHDVSPESLEEVEHQPRRVPSSKWCKASPEESPAFTVHRPIDRKTSEKPSTTQEPAVHEGLAKQLSRKTIERRRSEKSLRDACSVMSSSVSSSVVTTPRLASDHANGSIPEIPPLPPVADIEAALTSKLLQQKRTTTGTAAGAISPSESFEALPYDLTAPAASKSPSPPASTASSSERTKRQLSKKLGKIFQKQKTMQEPSQARESHGPQPSSDTELSEPKDELAVTPPPSEEHKGSGTSATFISQLAAELRNDSDEDVPEEASSIHQTDGVTSRRQQGPIYLSHLASQPRGLESDAAVHIQEVEDSDDENDDACTIRRLSRSLSVTSNATTTSSRHMRTMSLIVEPDRFGSMFNLLNTAVEQETLQKDQDHGVETRNDASFSVPFSPATPAVQQTAKKGFLLTHRSSKIAQQFCLIEQQVLLAVDWEELVDCRWRDGIAASGGVQRLIQRFNSVCQWVASEIVTTRSMEERVQMIEKFIRVAQKCRMYANFATLLQILLGLQSPAVSRLQTTWARVGASEMRLLNDLLTFTSPTKNWKNLRDIMTVTAEEYGTTAEEGGGCIPFLGIYLSDLVFNAELPAYIEPPRRAAACDSLVLQQPLVNFHKHRITATVIKRILTFQNLARRYPFAPDPELYRQCLQVEPLDQERIRKLSLEIE